MKNQIQKIAESVLDAKTILSTLKDEFPEVYKNIYKERRHLILGVLSEEAEDKKVLELELKEEQIKRLFNDDRFNDYHENTIKNNLAENLDFDNLVLEYETYTRKKEFINNHIVLTYAEIIKYDIDEDREIYEKDFSRFAKILKSSHNIYLYGNAGNGKTTFAFNMAEELGLKLYAINSVKNEYSVKGFFDLEGNYQKSLYENWYEKGGVLLLDEADSYSSNGMLYLNQGIEINSKYMTLENGDIIQKNKNCYVIACANTDGEGRTNEYIGRNTMDKAFMNRFSKIQFKEYAYIHKKILGENYRTFKNFFERKEETLTTRNCVKIKKLLEVFEKAELISMLETKELEI